jgi:hypothetical protein
MNTLRASLLAAAVLALGACATGYYGPHPVAYDGYYDDFYGPFYDGYWGDDGGFYYTDGPHHPFHRDAGGHFRHDMAQGFHPVHGLGGHGGGHAGGEGHHG